MPLKDKDTTTINIELQDNYSSGLRHRSVSSPSRAKVPNITVTVPPNEEEHHEPQDLTSSQFFSYIYNICEGEGFDKTDFYQKIDLLHAKHRLYDVLLSQNEKDQDTLLHVAIKKGKIDLTKEILHILDESYKLDSFYKDKYFEREKPLFKVVSTKNKERKSVITLVIEGSDLEHMAAVFEYLACGEEIKQLLIECCGEVNDACEVLADNNKKSAQAKWFLSKGQLIFALLAGTGSCIQIFRQISRIAFGVTDRDIPYAGSVIGEFLDFVAALPGLIILSNCVAGRMLSSYEKKDSILEERFKSCMEKRDKLGSELESALQCKVCTEEVGKLREELRSFRESCSTQVNSTPTQLEVSTVDSIFASPGAKISNS